MKIRLGTLRRLIGERASRRMLREDNSVAHEEGASGASLDAQVDRYFVQYETDAKKADEPTTDQMESIDWRDLIKGRLVEAGEGDKDEDDKGEAPGADELTGNDTGKLGLDRLDVEKFAGDVFRLIENYDSLLEVRNTLVRRAHEFVAKSYDDKVVKAFDDVLRDDHGIVPGEDKAEVDADRYPAPAAARASGSAEPGPGGGGA